MKRVALLTAVMVIVLTASAAPALAHGACCGAKAAAGYALCPVEDCPETGLHLHDGAYCTAHYYGDGHDYHDYCGVKGCSFAGYHAHDGAYCFGRASSEGLKTHRGRGGHR